jgi:hypothetical protein
MASARTNALRCTGKVTLVERKTIRAILLTEKGEVIGDLDRKYFPRGKRLFPGRIFKYYGRTIGSKDLVTIRIPKLKRVTKAQFERIRRQVERELAGVTDL